MAFSPAGATNLATVSVSTNPEYYGRGIPAEFIGISEDHNDIAHIVGSVSDSGSVTPTFTRNQAYCNLLQNLTNAEGSSGTLSLRIEGDLMEPTGTIAGVGGGLPNLPQSDMMPALEDLASTGIPIHFILGVDMASDNSSWTATEAETYHSDLPSSVIDGYEIGNEPDYYSGQHYSDPTVYVSDPTSAPTYLTQWQTFDASINSMLGTTAHITGPSCAASGWETGTTTATNLILDLPTAFSPSIYSQHCYPFNDTMAPDVLIANNPSSPHTYLRNPAATIADLYDAECGSVRADGVRTTFRIGEFNSVSGGWPGVSNAFQAALWVIDNGFNLLNYGTEGTGMCGFNIHSGQYVSYSLWQFSASPKGNPPLRTLLYVPAPYYGMLVLAETLGSSTHLLNTSITTTANVDAWSTVDANSNVHVVIINRDETNSGPVVITAPNYNTVVSAKLLTAPSYSSAPVESSGTWTTGITYAGQTFDGSPSGTLTGTETFTPVTGGTGTFTVSNVPVTSAVVITLSQ